jgi:hypothetical protein
MFEHDCKREGCCSYVGSTNRSDIYIASGGSLIRRFSSEGYDYSSLPVSAFETLRENDPEIDAALKLYATWLADHQDEPTTPNLF